MIGENDVENLFSIFLLFVKKKIICSAILCLFNKKNWQWGLFVNGENDVEGNHQTRSPI